MGDKQQLKVMGKKVPDRKSYTDVREESNHSDESQQEDKVNEVEEEIENMEEEEDPYSAEN